MTKNDWMVFTGWLVASVGFGLWQESFYAGVFTLGVLYFIHAKFD